jgi:hypothetical protein
MPETVCLAVPRLSGVMEPRRPPDSARQQLLGEGMAYCSEQLLYLLFTLIETPASELVPVHVCSR